MRGLLAFVLPLAYYVTFAHYEFVVMFHYILGKSGLVVFFSVRSGCASSLRASLFDPALLEKGGYCT